MSTPKKRTRVITGKAPVEDVEVTAVLASPQAPEDDLLHPVDAEGQVVNDDAYLASLERAKKVEPLEFSEGSLTHKVEVKAIQVSWGLTRQWRRRRRTLLLQSYGEAGVPIPDDNGELSDEDARKVTQAMTRLTAEDEEFQLLCARMALEATVRDDKGRLRISVPHWRTGVKPEDLIDNEAGISYINAVMDFLPQ